MFSVFSAKLKGAGGEVGIPNMGMMLDPSDPLFFLFFFFYPNPSDFWFTVLVIALVNKRGWSGPLGERSDDGLVHGCMELWSRTLNK